MSIEKLFGDFYKEESVTSQGLALQEKRRKEGGLLTRRRRAAVALLLVLTLLSGIMLQNLIFKKQMDQVSSTPSPLPTQEKVADGAWILKNRDPIKQTLAKGTVDTTLKENTKASEQLKSQISNRKSTSKNSKSGVILSGTKDLDYSPLAQNDTEVYRWSVKLPSGTVFAFGQQTEKGILPVVKVTNEDGWYVRYYPRLKNNDEGLTNKNENRQSLIINRQSLPYVTPKVKGNVISWQIAEGITARYTMQNDRVKADYVVDSSSSLVDGNKLDFIVETNSGKLDRATKSDTEVVKQIKQGWGEVALETMPTGEIVVFNDLQQELFTLPVPVIKEGDKGAAKAITLKNQQKTRLLSGFFGESRTSVVAPDLRYLLIPQNQQFVNPNLFGINNRGDEGNRTPATQLRRSSATPVHPHAHTSIAKPSLLSQIVKPAHAAEISTDEKRIPTDSDPRKSFDGSYNLKQLEQETLLLSIILPQDKLENSSWPLTIDPVVVDAAASATGTAYGNGRKILRDAYGNLLAFMDGGIGADNVYYKNYNSSSWTDANIDLDEDSASSQTKQISADLDSTGSAHLVFTDDFVGRLYYKPLKITRDANNAISSIGTTAILILDQTIIPLHRPSLIVVNKGVGGAAEKVAVAWTSNEAGNGARRGEIRFMQCSLSDGCGTAASWKNADASENGSGACTDGTAGFPSSVTCTGAADPILRYTTAATTHHGVLTQIPGRPKRSPESTQKDINGTFTDLPNTRDNATGTSDDVNSLTTTDYIYIGDSVKFSKVTADIVNTNSTGSNMTTLQYCSAVSGGSCTTWSNLANAIDNTDDSLTTFVEDGSLLFDEPSDWVQATVNGVTNKYWIRMRPNAALDSTVSVAEFYITDRNARALMVVGGVDATNDLRAAYIPWDEVANDRWENNPASGNDWRADAGGASSALSDTGFESTTFIYFVLSASTDPINNRTYVGYMSGTAVGSSNIAVESIPNNKDVTISGNWTDTALPAMTEASDSVISLTSDGQDIYLFYVLNPEVNSLVWRKCSPGNAGLGNVCDNASDWGSENTLAAFLSIELEPIHPQAVVTKAFGDTIAIDVIYTTVAPITVQYERHYVDMAYSTRTVTASGDDAYHRDCVSGTDDMDIASASAKLGTQTGDTSCDASANSLNHAGFRFPAIPITQGAKIASAYLDFRVNTRIGATPISFTLYGEDTDSAAVFAASTNCTDPCSGAIDERTRTTSSYAQSLDLRTHTYRVDVTNLIQEIVCRGATNAQPCVGDFNNGSGAWSPQGNIGILLINSGSGSNYALITSQDDTGTVMLDPTLQINLGNSSYDFSMGSATQLATGSASFTNLDHPLATSSGELASVLTDDTHYASISATNQYASSSGVPAFMFKVNNTNNNNTYKIDATAIVKSTATTSAKPIYLQVYRDGSTDNWETVASNNSSPGDTDITLDMPEISSSVSEYYHAKTPGGTCNATGTDCWVYFRLYQDAPTTLQNETLSVDYFNVTFSLAPTQIVFTNPTRTFLTNTCSGASNPFTMELQSDSGTAVNPLSTTVVRVTSSSPGAVIYSDDTCSTPVTNGDFTYTTAQSSKTFYVQDTTRGGFTLTGTRQSGDTLTTGTHLYGVTIPSLPESSTIQGGVNFRGGSTIR